MTRADDAAGRRRADQGSPCAGELKRRAGGFNHSGPSIPKLVTAKTRSASGFSFMIVRCMSSVSGRVHGSSSSTARSRRAGSPGTRRNRSPTASSSSSPPGPATRRTRLSTRSTSRRRRRSSPRCSSRATTSRPTPTAPSSRCSRRHGAPLASLTVVEPPAFGVARGHPAVEEFLAHFEAGAPKDAARLPRVLPPARRVVAEPARPAPARDRGGRAGRDRRALARPGCDPARRAGGGAVPQARRLRRAQRARSTQSATSSSSASAPSARCSRARATRSPASASRSTRCWRRSSRARRFGVRARLLRAGGRGDSSA